MANKRLERFVKSLYNEPTNSDIILVFNDIKYYLILSLIKHCAPLLYEEFRKQQEIDLVNSSNSVPEQVIENLSTIITRSNRTTISISNPIIKQSNVEHVLRIMYGHPMI